MSDDSTNSETQLLQDDNDCGDMKPDNNELEHQKPAKMRVIVLGKSGTGKSSLCNQLVRKEIEEKIDESLASLSSQSGNEAVGKEREKEFDESSSSTSSSTPLSSSSSPPLPTSSIAPFRVGAGLQSITTQCQQETVDKYNYCLTVVDTPSTDSTDNRQLMSELKKQATKAGDKTILVFCVRSDARFAAEEYNIYKDLKNNWGDEKDFCRRLIVVFTHEDKLDEDEDHTQERRKKQQQIPEIQKPSEKKEEESSVENLEKECKEEKKNEQEQVQKRPLEKEVEEEPKCRETQASIYFIEEREKFAHSMPVRSSVQAASVKTRAEIREDIRQCEPCPSTKKDEDLGPRKSLTPPHKKGINYGSTEIADKPSQRDDPFQQTPKFSSNKEGTPRASEAAIYHKQAAEEDAFQPMAAEKTCTSSTEHVTSKEKMIQEKKKSDADEPFQQNARYLERAIEDSVRKEEFAQKNKGKGDEIYGQGEGKEAGITKGASPTIDILPALTTFTKTKRELNLDEKLEVTWPQLQELLKDAEKRYVLISNKCVDDRAVKILLDVAKNMNTDGQGLKFADSLEEPVDCFAVLLNFWELITELLVWCVLLCVVQCGPCFRRCRDCWMWCCRCCRRCCSRCRRWCDTNCCSCCFRCCRKYYPDCEDPRTEDIELKTFQTVGETPNRWGEGGRGVGEGGLGEGPSVGFPQD